MSDRPETQGLPNGAVYYGEKTPEQIAAEKQKSVGAMQWNAVVKNPAVWILGLSSLCVYVAVMPLKLGRRLPDVAEGL